MKLKINKSGIDENGVAFSYIRLESYVEEFKGYSKIRSICYKQNTSEIIIPTNWKKRKLGLIKLNSVHLEEKDTKDFYLNFLITYLISTGKSKSETLKYKMNVYELDEISGEPKKDSKSGKNIIKFKLNAPILKDTGNFIYTKTKYVPFCKQSEIKILNKK